ncbi:MAG TPA: diguanylate cyclase [Methylotenera sp.]|nr:diguanylate cyclase [Methylotenera sp.]
MLRGNTQYQYRAFLITVGFPLGATAVQWFLWPFIKPFSWFIYWPAICLCILCTSFAEGVFAILLASFCAWWFFVPTPLSWIKQSSFSYISLLIFISANVLASHFYNRTKKSRQRSETSLSRVNTTYQQLLESLADGVFVAQDYKFVFFNHAMPTMLGYTSLEFTHISFEKVVAPAYLDLWKLRFEQRIEGEAPERCYEVQFIHKEGHYVWIELRANRTLYFDRMAVLGIVRDISLRKKHQEKLHLADAVFQNTQEGIVITDLQRNIVLSNPAFSTITEYSAEELSGAHLHFLYAQDKNQLAMAEKQQSLDEAGSWQGALWKRRKSGDVYREWVVVSTIRNEQGMPLQYIDISLDISKMKHVETHMEYLAQHDALTDLPNRLLLHSRLNHTLERAKRKNEKCAVMFMDIDKFKVINDTYGHAAGDEVLKIAASRMKARIRDTDTLARLSGDEFVLVLDAINSIEAAAEVAKAIVEALNVPCELADGTIIQTGISIGISIFPDDGTHAAWLLNLADKALYTAKNGGRGMWRFYKNDNTPERSNFRR